MKSIAHRQSTLFTKQKHNFFRQETYFCTSCKVLLGMLVFIMLLPTTWEYPLLFLFSSHPEQPLENCKCSQFGRPISSFMLLCCPSRNSCFWWLTLSPTIVANSLTFWIAGYQSRVNTDRCQFFQRQRVQPLVPFINATTKPIQPITQVGHLLSV